jgi:hypothetical protein
VRDGLDWKGLAGWVGGHRVIDAEQGRFAVEGVEGVRSGGVDGSCWCWCWERGIITTATWVVEWRGGERQRVCSCCQIE